MQAPGDWKVLNPLAVALAETGKLEEAIATLRQSTKADPDQSATWVKLGVALGQAGDKQGAAEAFREALRLQPDLVEARHLLERLGQN